MATQIITLTVIIEAYRVPLLLFGLFINPIVINRLNSFMETLQKNENGAAV